MNINFYLNKSEIEDVSLREMFVKFIAKIEDIPYGKVFEIERTEEYWKDMVHDFMEDLK